MIHAASACVSSVTQRCSKRTLVARRPTSHVDAGLLISVPSAKATRLASCPGPNRARASVGIPLPECSSLPHTSVGVAQPAGAGRCRQVSVGRVGTHSIKVNARRPGDQRYAARAARSRRRVADPSRACSVAIDLAKERPAAPRGRRGCAPPPASSTSRANESPLQPRNCAWNASMQARLPGGAARQLRRRETVAHPVARRTPPIAKFALSSHSNRAGAALQPGDATSRRRAPRRSRPGRRMAWRTSSSTSSRLSAFSDSCIKE